MRNDIHSPTNFDPANYVYVGSFDQWPEAGAFVSQTRNEYKTDFGIVDAFTYDHAEYLGGKKLMQEHGVDIHYNQRGSCDHCGARIRYVAIFKHKDGKHIAVGSTCANDRFGCDSRREYDVKRLKEKAADAKERAKSFGRANDFVQANCPELSDWLLSPACETVHAIFAEMSRKLIRFGNLSEKQLDFARKLLQEYYERQKNNGKTLRELAWEEEKAKAEDCPIGRTVITGTIIKTQFHESSFGETLKMTVKDDRGFVVWMTVPDSLSLVGDGDTQRGLERGDRVSVTATLTRSDKDVKFGFGKRPSGGRFLSKELANVVALIGQCNMAEKVAQ